MNKKVWITIYDTKYKVRKPYLKFPAISRENPIEKHLDGQLIDVELLIDREIINSCASTNHTYCTYFIEPYYYSGFIFGTFQMQNGKTMLRLSPAFIALKAH